MLMKEYRICMPLTVEEYRIGQLYMISKHSCEESDGGDGVEVVRNEQDTHPLHGVGQVTEKRIYLTSKLPTWIKTFVPQIFYVTETAWNFYPYTVTEYSVSFLPKFSVRIETRFENNNGCNNNTADQRGRMSTADKREELCCTLEKSRLVNITVYDTHSCKASSFWTEEGNNFL